MSPLRLHTRNSAHYTPTFSAAAAAAATLILRNASRSRTADPSTHNRVPTAPALAPRHLSSRAIRRLTLPGPSRGFLNPSAVCSPPLWPSWGLLNRFAISVAGTTASTGMRAAGAVVAPVPTTPAKKKATIAVAAAGGRGPKPAATAKTPAAATAAVAVATVVTAAAATAIAATTAIATTTAVASDVRLAAATVVFGLQFFAGSAAPRAKPTPIFHATNASSVSRETPAPAATSVILVWGRGGQTKRRE